MKFLRKIIEYIKNKYIKKTEKLLNKNLIYNTKSDKLTFGEKLQVNVLNNSKYENKISTDKEKIKTLKCNGDGLGIQSKITY